jgi:hypothetical protein
MKGELAVLGIKVAIHDSYAKATLTACLCFFVDIRDYYIFVTVTVEVCDKEARQKICITSKTRIAEVVGNKRC